MSGVIAIVIGVLLLFGGPWLNHRRNDPRTQQTAGLGRAAGGGISSGAPRSARQLRVDAVVAVILGLALIVYGIATL